MSSIPSALPSDASLRELAHAVLVQARILRQEDELLAPPYCVWGMPRTNEGKRAGRAKANLRRGRDSEDSIAPALHFLGAPEMGLRAAGISLGQPECEVNARDSRWLYDRMTYIRDRGSVVYGSQWAAMSFARPDGVNTNTMQRLYEYLSDQIAFRPEQELREILLGQRPALVEFSCKASFRDVTGDTLDDDSILWNLAAHPEFVVMTTHSRGEITQRTLARFAVVEAISAADHWTGHQIRPGYAQGIVIQLSRAAVAMAIGQAIRLAEIEFGSDYVTRGYGEIPGELTQLRTWFWARVQAKLPEYERRLARHLILSPGGENNYNYLLTPVYAAEVLGCRVSEDRRHRFRVPQTLQDVAANLLTLLPELTGIEFQMPGTRAHLEQALASILRPVQKFQTTGQLPLFDEEPSEVIHESVEDLLGAFARDLDRLEREVQDERRKKTEPFGEGLEGCRIKSEVSKEDPEERRKKTEVPLHPPTQTINSPVCDISVSENYKYSTSTYINKNIFCSVPLCTENPESEPETEAEQIFQPEINPENKPEPSRSDQTGSPSEKSLSWEKKYLATGRETWPEALIHELGVYLRPSQLAMVQTLCVWSPEGAWAILQCIRRERLKWPESTFWNALRDVSKGSVYLLKTASLLHQAGWMEIPEDGTPRENPDRAQAAQRLRGYQRLPLDADGLEKRAQILREEAERREEETRAEARRKQEQAEAFQERAARHSEHQERQENGEPEDGEAQTLTIWLQIRQALEESLPDRSFRDWVAPLLVTCLQENTLWLQAPSSASKTWIETQMIEEFHEALEETGHSHLRLRIVA